MIDECEVHAGAKFLWGGSERMINGRQVTVVRVHGSGARSTVDVDYTELGLGVGHGGYCNVFCRCVSYLKSDEMSFPEDWRELKTEHPTKVLMYRDDTTHHEDIWWVFNEDVSVVRIIFRWELVLNLGNDVICCGVPEPQCTDVVAALQRAGRGVVHVIKSVRRLATKQSDV